MGDINPFTVEHMAAGVIRERSSDSELYIFNIDNSHPATISRWADSVREVLKDWPTGRPCLLLHDLHRAGSVIFKDSMREELHDLFSLRTDIRRNVAFVMPAADLDDMRLFIMMLRLKSFGVCPVHYEVFRTRREALDWLLRARMKWR